MYAEEKPRPCVSAYIRVKKLFNKPGKNQQPFRTSDTRRQADTLA
jgi:hypothetical protein